MKIDDETVEEHTARINNDRLEYAKYEFEQAKNRWEFLKSKAEKRGRVFDGPCPEYIPPMEYVPSKKYLELKNAFIKEKEIADLKARVEALEALIMK